MADAKAVPQYVPILKFMQGEYTAMEVLSGSTQDALIPLFEVPQLTWDDNKEAFTKTLDAHLSPVAKRLEKARGHRKAFIDLGYLPPPLLTSEGTHPVEKLFADCRALGLNAIPVTGVDRDKDYQAAVARVVAADHRGVCIRVEQEDFFDGSFANLIGQVVAGLGVAPAEVDLVIDLGEIRESQMALLMNAVPGALATIPALSDWRSLVLAGSAFPESLASIKGFGTISRLEWRLWKALRSRTPALPRMPIFGDYAVQSAVLPEPEAANFSGAANIRYTGADEWFIFRGRKLTTYGFEQYFDLSEQLTKHPCFNGEAYSWGDGYVARCAFEKDSTGNQSTWRKVGTNHHLTFVVNQIASLSGA